MARPSESDEMMANMTGMWRSLTRAEQDAWLTVNQLARAPSVHSSHSPPGSNDGGIDTMTMSSPGRPLKGGRSPPQHSPSTALVPHEGGGAMTPYSTGSAPGASPARSAERFDVQRSQWRSSVALRLARPPKEELEPLPMINVAQAKFTDADLRPWFNELDKNGNGWLSYDEFLAFYKGRESFGAPIRLKDVQQKLKNLRAFDDERMSYEEFALLVLELAKQ